MTDALQHIETNVPRALPDELAGAVRDRLLRQPHASLQAVYLVDQADRLTGVVPMTSLYPAAPDLALSALAMPTAATAGPHDDEEHVASVAFESKLADVPIVDDAGRLLGIVPATAIIGILRHEHVEDMRRMAGITAQDRRSRQALEDDPLRRLMQRLPWLLVGLGGSMVATAVVASYEHVVSTTVAVSFFVPALVYLADAIGTQTEAAAVRLLSFGAPKLGPLLIGEIVTGLLIGSSLGVIAFPVIVAFVGDLRLALAVSLSLAIAGTLATTTAILLPWLLWRVGQDPALGSGPLATIIQDVLSLLIYFSVVGFAIA